MELFKYRNLALGSCFFLGALFFSFYFTTVTRVAILALAGIAIVLLCLAFAVKNGKRTLYCLCHFTPAMLFVILAMILSLIHFDKSELQKYCDNTPHQITATVTDVLYQKEYLGYYEIQLDSIDGDEFSDKLKLEMYTNPLKRGDVIKSVGIFTAFEQSSPFFDEAGYYLSHGITVSFSSDNYEIIGFSPMPITDFLENTNSFLDKRFEKVGVESTHAMLSALFLGNREHLDDSVQRDFWRIGLSHVLALSGMHITIIVTLFGYALYAFPIRRIFKELLLISTTVLFVGITGFSSSAMRAGVMVCLVYTLFFFGNRLSLTSALFFSVTILCVADPFSIFSTSLLLSFFALLGCIVSGRLIRRARLYKRVRSRLLRFVTFTFISSVFASLFTLPIISIQFGSFAILSPVTNILVAPLFSILIYLAPVFLIVADIPYFSDFVSWLCTKITELATSLGKWFSSTEDIVIPIINTPQFIGVIICAIFLFLLLIVKRRYSLHTLVGVFCGVLVFIGGSVFLHLQRANNAYAGAYNFNDGDIVFLENFGELTVFDISICMQSSKE